MMEFIAHQSGSLRIEQTSAPISGAGQVVVAVEAFGVNRADLMQRGGHYPPPKGESEILGLEVAGVITEVGPGVTQWTIGDKVCALVAGGGYARLVCVNAAHVIPIPTGMDMYCAAALPEAYLTAFGALVPSAHLAAGQKVLIHAGASGVGSAAIQIAKIRGAEVAVSASSAEKLAFCQALGADLAVNYRTEDITEVILSRWGGVDVIIDVVGAEHTNANLRLLNMDGHLIQLAIMGGRFVQAFDMGRLLQKRATLVGSTLRNRSEQYKTRLVTDFIEQHWHHFVEGSLRVALDSAYPAHEIERAHQRMSQNLNLGKMVGYWP